MKKYILKLFLLAGALMLKKVKGFKKSMDYTEYGGAPLLGLSKPVIKAHGSSDAKAIFHAIRQAMHCVQSGITYEIAAMIAAEAENNSIQE